MTAAFDDQELYELTALAREFVQFIITDIPPKLGFAMDAENGACTDDGSAS